MEKISILGSTGSIGQNTLDVAARLGDRFRVVGLAAGENVDIFMLDWLTGKEPPAA